MHEGLKFDMDLEFMAEIAITTFLAILAWFINAVKSMAVSKLDELDKKHAENSARIDKQCEKLQEHRTEIEVLKSTSIKRADLDAVFSGLRDELKEDIDKVFVGVQERIDKFYANQADMMHRRDSDRTRLDK